LHNVLFQNGIFLKRSKGNKICYNETYAKYQTCKHVSDAFCMTNCLKQEGDAISFLFKFGLGYAVRMVYSH
jgi:hypothetical protein